MHDTGAPHMHYIRLVLNLPYSMQPDPAAKRAISAVRVLHSTGGPRLGAEKEASSVKYRTASDAT